MDGAFVSALSEAGVVITAIVALVVIVWIVGRKEE